MPVYTCLYKICDLLHPWFMVAGDFFYKEMGSFEKQTDLEQNWTDSFSAFRY